MFIYLVESWISAGGFLWNVNISIKENTGNILTQYFGFFFFPLFGWGQKGKTQQEGNDDAAENLL